MNTQVFKLKLNEKINLNKEDYFVFDEYTTIATNINTKTLLEYLKWRKENNVYLLKNKFLPNKVNKSKIYYGYLYIKRLNKLFMFVFRTKSGISIWKIYVNDKSTWNRIRYAINKYGEELVY